MGNQYCLLNYCDRLSTRKEPGLVPEFSTIWNID